jgi:hypothetical protein
MKRATRILALIVFIGACSAPEEKANTAADADATTKQPPSDAGHDTSEALDTDPGQPDIGTDAPDLIEIPEGDCPQLDDHGCYLRDDCAWTGTTCYALDETAAATEPLTTRTPGVLTSRGHSQLPDGDLTASLTAIQTLGSLRGAITVEGAGEKWSFPIDAEVDGLAGTMSLDVYVPECFVGEGSCDQTRHAFEVEGFHDGSQWLFPRPRAVGEALEPLFVNLRFQPNDGIKPSMVPDRTATFSGPLSSVFDGSPLPTEASNCDLVFDGADIATAPPIRLDCGDVVIETTGETRIVSESYSYLDQGSDEPSPLWFRIETPQADFTFVALDQFSELAGLFVRDDGSYWSSDADPISPDDVDASDTVGAAVLFAEEAN